MDKQKQIEEMARTTCNYNAENFESCVECIRGGLLSCDRLVQAEKLYNAGYRKIPEDAVVLTREEYVESGDMYIDGKMEMQRYYDEVEIPKVKKETAEKFEKMALKEIKAISVKNEEYLLEDESVYEDSSLENVLEKVKIEICKEITDKGVQNGN